MADMDCILLNGQDLDEPIMTVHHELQRPIVNRKRALSFTTRSLESGGNALILKSAYDHVMGFDQPLRHLA